ncbi:porin [Brevundimonas sp. Leaf363]|uniref:carbohydrate porin n=1 Tax=Brevundimonas sp. Leaf363 TaxID=1736353 RepID=UPI0006FBFCAE|nr:carbohydrate porin [Brevundimonas sp. Leaf363]KQS55537.1 porin [Brevundimonas sp. Leaf363]
MGVFFRAGASGAVGVLLSASPVWAERLDEPGEPVWTWGSAYTADVIGVVDGAPSRAGRFLDNLDVALDGDLDRQFGWRGARVHVSLLANGGGQPNAVAQTLEGIDNIEVGSPGVRLYEAWVKQTLAGGRGSVLAGLYDVNSEFYVTAASDQLIAPPFGIGSELAATGPNGPAIFPSTSLAVRFRLGDPEGRYAQVAAVNAQAGTLGDDGGVDTTLDQGVLYLAEAGWSGPVRVAVGGWRYSEGQDDIRDVLPGGDPALSHAQGAYAVVEGTLFEAEDQPTIRAFMRLGVSDGDTTLFSGGWQAGLRVDSVLAARPASTLSLGFHEGVLSDKARANAREAGVRFARAEGGIELTYADTFGPVTLQPNLQWIYNPGGDADRDPLLTAGVRLILALH